jgi:hypothetical protein
MARAERKTPPPNAIQSACPDSRRLGTARGPLWIRSVTSPSGGGAASPLADASAIGAASAATDAGCRTVSGGGAASATAARGVSVLANSPVTGFFGGGGGGGLGDGRAVPRTPGSFLGGLDTSTVGESDPSAGAASAGLFGGVDGAFLYPVIFQESESRSPFSSTPSGERNSRARKALNRSGARGRTMRRRSSCISLASA